MTEELGDVRVGVLVANEGIEQVELTEPWEAVLGAGGRPSSSPLSQAPHRP